MASRGTTFAKQDRDRAKKARAAEKRERRQDRQAKAEAGAEATTDVELPAEGQEIPAADLLRLVEQLHEDFAAKRIDFEEFEERKADLMARISV
jgi:hypothetical protein